jgi:hypothetical protein
VNKVEILYFDGCPTYREAEKILPEVLGEQGEDAEVALVAVNTDEEAKSSGSPVAPRSRFTARTCSPCRLEPRRRSVAGCTLPLRAEGFAHRRDGAGSVGRTQPRAGYVVIAGTTEGTSEGGPPSRKRTRPSPGGSTRSSRRGTSSGPQRSWTSTPRSWSTGGTPTIRPTSCGHRSAPELLRTPASVGCSVVRRAPISGKDHMHPHLAREAIVRDVETTRYGRDYAGRRGKITHVDKDPQTGAATGYVVRMEDGGYEVRFESEEIRIMEAWD